MIDVAAGDATLFVEIDANEFAESRRVVVAHRLCIAESCNQAQGAYVTVCVADPRALDSSARSDPPM
jgi:hypothetical protein